MAALNLLLFLLFGALYISRGIQLRLVDPLAQARDRLIRKISDGELLLAELPEDGLGEELRFLRTLEQSGPDLAVLLEDGRAVYYDETQDAMREGAIPDPFADARPLSGIQFRIDPIHGWMALTSTQVDDPAGGSALVLAALPLNTLARDLLPVLGLLALSTFATICVTRRMSRQLSLQLVQPLQDMAHALAHWQGEQYDPPPALGAADELGELRDAMEKTAQQLELARDRHKKEDEALRLFYADVSHELKTPIAVLRAQVELMRDGMLESEELPAQADGMLAELQQLQTVVQDLVTLARMQAPGYQVERQACSLSEILRDAGRSLNYLACKHGIRFSLELPVSDPVQDLVLTNYDRLRQLVMILGENAIKYTRPDGCAGMRLEYTSDGPAVLIWDQGAGIPPEDRDRIFWRFYRGSRKAGVIPGEGLGLAIARELCELLDAPVKLERTGPEGSLFSLHPPSMKQERLFGNRFSSPVTASAVTFGSARSIFPASLNESGPPGFRVLASFFGKTRCGAPRLTFRRENKKGLLQNES